MCLPQNDSLHPTNSPVSLVAVPPAQLPSVAHPTSVLTEKHACSCSEMLDQTIIIKRCLWGQYLSSERISARVWERNRWKRMRQTTEGTVKSVRVCVCEWERRIGEIRCWISHRYPYGTLPLHVCYMDRSGISLSGPHWFINKDAKLTWSSVDRLLFKDHMYHPLHLKQINRPHVQLQIYQALKQDE